MLNPTVTDSRMLNNRLSRGERKIGIVNEIVRNAVDVPGDAHRIDQTENEHDPNRDTRKKIKHAEEVHAV